MSTQKPASEEQWYWAKQGSDERNGPVSWEHLKELAEEGNLEPEDLVRREGFDDWEEAGSVEGTEDKEEMLFGEDKVAPEESVTYPPVSKIIGGIIGFGLAWFLAFAVLSLTLYIIFGLSTAYSAELGFLVPPFSVGILFLAVKTGEWAGNKFSGGTGGIVTASILLAGLISIIAYPFARAEYEVSNFKDRKKGIISSLSQSDSLEKAVRRDETYAAHLDWASESDRKLSSVYDSLKKELDIKN